MSDEKKPNINEEELWKVIGATGLLQSQRRGELLQKAIHILEQYQETLDIEDKDEREERQNRLKRRFIKLCVEAGIDEETAETIWKILTGDGQSSWR